MKLIGITGGIGMGKSTMAEFLGERGLPIVDTDQIARDVVQRGEPALQEIVEAFGPDMISGDGSLDRRRLAAAVFEDKEAKARLESILHPRIRSCWKSLADHWSRDNAAIGFVVIPLLYETGAEREFDAIICVACPEAMQHTRLIERGWTESEIKARIAAQLPTAEKIARADHLIWTSGPVGSAHAQMERLLSKLEKR